MCQTRVVLEKSGDEEMLLDNVTGLEVSGDRVSITTLFEGAREYTQVEIAKIDFSAGKVTLTQTV